MIHSTALVSSKAQVDPTVEVGAYAVIDAGVVVGPRCRVGPHVYLTGATVIGAGNQFHAGCVIGDAPQDLKYKGEPTSVVIGDDNVFREGCTVHRSAKVEEATVIGSRNFLMVNSHVGHNAQVGDQVILVNGALLAGHAHVGDRAFISGNCLVHQFVRVGTLAIMQGGSAVSRDLPPFTISYGVNTTCGLNVIGLRRAGVKPDERMELKKVYRLLLHPGRNLNEALAEARQQFTTASAKILIEFIAASKRGICVHHGQAHGETQDDENIEL